MSNRAKIVAVLAVVIVAALVIFYLFDGNQTSAPLSPAPAQVAASIAAPGPSQSMMSAPPIAPGAKIMPPNLTPAQIAAFNQPLPAAGQNAASVVSPPTQEEIKAITKNLRQLANAAQSFMMEKDQTSANYNDLVGYGTDKYIRSIDPVVGEDYTGIELKAGDSQMTISAPDGSIIIYNL